MPELKKLDQVNIDHIVSIETSNKSLKIIGLVRVNSPSQQGLIIFKDSLPIISWKDDYTIYLIFEHIKYRLKPSKNQFEVIMNWASQEVK